MTSGRALWWAVATAYVAGLVWLVAGADAWSLNRLTVRLYVAGRGLAPDGALPEHYGIVLNVLLFVPLGWLVAHALARPWWQATAAVAGVSAAVELVQLHLLDRQAELVDLAANTVGGLLGVLLARLSLSPVRRPRSG